MLRCPVTGQAVNVISEDRLLHLNARILTGEVSNVGGDAVDKPWTGGLESEDGQRIYPLHEGVPVLLEGESIHLG